MTLHKTISIPARLWLGRGTQGSTTQEVVVERQGDRVRLSVRRVGGSAVEVDLAEDEVAALREWLGCRTSALR